MLSQALFIQQHLKPHQSLQKNLGRHEFNVCWSPPPAGCYKVNVDGSHLHNGRSACGGLIRRDNGSFVQGFHCNIGSGNAVWAELWGHYLGIKLARQPGLHWVVFELDSMVIVDMVNAEVTANASLRPLLQHISCMLRDPSWRTSVVHTFRETNGCADFLARKGHESSSSFEWVVLDRVCPSLGLLIANYVRGTLLPRVSR